MVSVEASILSNSVTSYQNHPFFLYSHTLSSQKTKKKDGSRQKGQRYRQKNRKSQKLYHHFTRLAKVSFIKDTLWTVRNTSTQASNSAWPSIWFAPAIIADHQPTNSSRMVRWISEFTCSSLRVRILCTKALSKHVVPCLRPTWRSSELSIMNLIHLYEIFLSFTSPEFRPTVHRSHKNIK